MDDVVGILRFECTVDPQEQATPQYNSELVVLLLSILDSCTASGNCIRLITLRLAIMLLMELLRGAMAGGNSTATTDPQSRGPNVEAEGSTAMLQDHHIALVESIYESAILRLRMFYRVCTHVN